ncbi:MAG: hypothetical protein ACRD0K_12970 [Egibacteraceae bacterium]
MRLQDLPVVVDLPGRLGEEVSAYVEVEAGWQVVGPGGALVPALELTAAPRAGLPCVVVREGPIQAEDVRAALLGGALDVIAWPEDRARLLEAPLRINGARGHRPGPAVLRVAGCGGGVGTSTIALALGGLLAWSGRKTVVVGDEDLLRLCGLGPWPGPTVPEHMSLRPGDPEVTALARPLPGVDRLSILGGGGCAVESTAGWPVEAVVIDLRAPRHLARADVVCARPDSGLAVLEDQPGNLPVLVVGDGPLDQAAVRRRLGRPPVAWLPRSARVARAGLSGTVPSALPGSWLKALRAGLGRIQRQPGGQR